jgi:hypothetical protein
MRSISHVRVWNRCFAILIQSINPPVKPWYVDDAEAGVKFEAIRAMFEELIKAGPASSFRNSI